MSKTLMDFVQEAKKNITEVAVNQAFELAKDGYKIIDVRETSEFADGHIANSINVPRGVLESAIDINNKNGNKELQQGRNGKWLVLCRTSVRSALATQVMQQMGFADVINIEGGIVAWEEANLPVVK